MLSPMNTALSGLSGSLRRLEAAAHNTANLSTNGFKKDTVLQSEGASGGVVVHIEKGLGPGPQLPEPDGTFTEGSNVDLAEEAVNQVLAKTEFSAHLAILKTADEMEKSMIDLFA
ncbi:MAG: flagellar basal body rod C-terminal domain-containing protein [Nitrospiria bacterium]